MTQISSKSKSTTDGRYGISRIDDEKHRTFAWRVSLRRHGRQLVRNFPDKKYGGKMRALHRAKEYRDELVRKYPPITRKEMCKIRRSNNTSGITGVCTYSKSYERRDGSIKENWYWEATWPNERGESVKKIFSVNSYGPELARQMAINARRRGIEDIKGVFWRSEPGDLGEQASRPASSIRSSRDEFPLTDAG